MAKIMSNHSWPQHGRFKQQKNDIEEFALKLFATYFMSKQNNCGSEVAFHKDFKSRKQSIL